MPRPRVTEANAVLDAAARRLGSHGIAGTAVDDVAAAAGVSRATVYRYVGGKDEIVQAVIDREAEQVLEHVAAAITRSTSAPEAIANAVSTAIAAIDENPVLLRLTSSDLRDTLPFITTDSRHLIERCVAVLSSALRAAPAFAVDDRAAEHALEEATRIVLVHVTTPRRDGSRLNAPDAGTRAATMIAPLLASAGT